MMEGQGKKGRKEGMRKGKRRKEVCIERRRESKRKGGSKGDQSCMLNNSTLKLL
jgi:hypothetical protein